MPHLVLHRFAKLRAPNTSHPVVQRPTGKDPQKLDELEERNRRLEAQVLDLQNGLDAYEEKARQELGMIKKGETFFQIVTPQPAAKKP